MNTNIFDKDLLSTKPEPETFFNLFTQDVTPTKEELHKYNYQFSQLSDMDKIEVYNLAQVNNKMRLYYMISTKEEGRGFEPIKCDTLPSRSTLHSAGYDFYAPEDVTIPPSIKKVHRDGYDTWEIGKPFLVKTGVKAYMQDDEVLLLYNRSSNPNKKGLVVANGVGVVDSDYYNNPDNEGEIGFLFYNLGFEDIVIKKGEKIGQGVFQKYLLADGDEAEGDRNGGFGSTGL